MKSWGIYLGITCLSVSAGNFPDARNAFNALVSPGALRFGHLAHRERVTEAGRYLHQSANVANRQPRKKDSEYRSNKPNGLHTLDKGLS